VKNKKISPFVFDYPVSNTTTALFHSLNQKTIYIESDLFNKIRVKKDLQQTEVINATIFLENNSFIVEKEYKHVNEICKMQNRLISEKPRIRVLYLICNYSAKKAKKVLDTIFWPKLVLRSA